jgi:hypothetical protein
MNKKIHIGLKVKFTNKANIGINNDWRKFLGKTFVVKDKTNKFVSIELINGNQTGLIIIHEFWDLFELISDQLEFDFNA